MLITKPMNKSPCQAKQSYYIYNADENETKRSLQTVNYCAPYEKRKPGIWKLFFEMKKGYSVTRKRSISLSYQTFISHESFWEKIRTKIFGLWPLPVKCDNTELLINVTKLGMNKMRHDEFVPFDIIWKTSSGKDCSDCFVSLSTESTQCNSSRGMGIRWKRKIGSLIFTSLWQKGEN